MVDLSHTPNAMTILMRIIRFMHTIYNANNVILHTHTLPGKSMDECRSLEIILKRKPWWALIFFYLSSWIMTISNKLVYVRKAKAETYRITPIWRDLDEKCERNTTKSWKMHWKMKCINTFAAQCIPCGRKHRLKSNILVLVLVTWVNT